MDLKNNLKALQSVAVSRSATATINGTSQDVSKYGSVLPRVAVGVIDAAITVDAKVQHCDDNSTWVDVTGGAITQIPNTGDNQIVTGAEYRRGNYGGAKKFLRWVVTVTGTGNADVFAWFECGMPDAAPV